MAGGLLTVLPVKQRERGNRHSRPHCAEQTGLERVFHLDEWSDPGFALLPGGHRCPCRYSVGGEMTVS